jgi:PAS domain S-box-containing protein
MRPVLTIRLKLLFLVLLASLPAVGLVLHSGIEAERQALHQAEDEALRITRDLALRQEHLTTSTRQFLATLARLPAVRNLDSKACGPLFRDLIAANPLLSDVILTSLTGEVLASARLTAPVGNLSQAAYFGQVLKTGEFAVGGYRKSHTTGLDVLVCGHPVLDSRRALVGVVSSGIRLDIFDSMVRDIPLPEGSTIYMADRQGLRLFNRHFPDPRPETYPLGVRLRANVWKRILEEAKGVPFFDIGADGQRRMYLVQEARLSPQTPPYAYVGVSLPEQAVLMDVRKSLRTGLALLTLATLLAAAAAWYTGKRIFVERIERLASVADSFAAGDLTARTNLPPPLVSGKPDELGQLGRAMDRIGEELSRREEEREATLQRLAKTQFAVDHAGDEIFWADEAGHFVYVNESGARNLGYAPQELLAMNVFDVDVDHAAKNWGSMLALLAATGPVTIETRHRTRAGALVPKEILVNLVNTSDGPLIFGSGRDISERKRHEAVLRSLLDETAAVTGQEFFPALTDQLVSLLAVPAAFVGEHLKTDPPKVRPLALAQSGESFPAEEFPLEHSPGCEIPRNGHLLISEGTHTRYPGNPYLQRMGIEGYLGVPLLNPEGEKIGHLSIMSRRVMRADPTLISTMRLFAQRAAAELLRLRAERDIRTSLREKEVLLKEIHHRVKNNMQIVSSLLSLQAREVNDPAMLDLLAESRTRILSMALVHEDLYQSGNLAQVDFRRYLERLAERTRSGIAGASRVAFELTLDELSLPVDQAIPLGLLCNELFTNALKHAFPGGGEGTVRVDLRREDGLAVITVRDNGRGLPPGYVPGEGATLGVQLVWSLADQLNGRAEAWNDGGAVFAVRFPVP